MRRRWLRDDELLSSLGHVLGMEHYWPVQARRHWMVLRVSFHLHWSPPFTSQLTLSVFSVQISQLLGRAFYQQLQCLLIFLAIFALWLDQAARRSDCKTLSMHHIGLLL
jgi:hypothetical protein